MYLEKWFQEKQWKSLQCPTSIQTTKTSHSQLCSISTSSSSTVSDTGVYLQADKTNGEAPVTFENKNSEHHTSHNSNCRSGLDSSNIFSNIVSNGAEVIASTSSYAYPKSKIYNEITPMIECKICTGQTHQYDKRGMVKDIQKVLSAHQDYDIDSDESLSILIASRSQRCTRCRTIACVRAVPELVIRCTKLPYWTK
eukprot:gene2450-8081_t